MGKSLSGHTKNNHNKDLDLVNVQVATLKERLNKLYDTRRGSHGRPQMAQDGLFEYLWDLKELALMEGRASVEVPSNWIEELEQSLTSGEVRRGH